MGAELRICPGHRAGGMAQEGGANWPVEAELGICFGSRAWRGRGRGGAEPEDLVGQG